ncbi:endonuclease III [Candidatus Curculioniphilus buchneri]|uniref:endonuclease III n=1 Tax=Candidatus Curculioniphilus buchneri TaxID=690594 RepID=UPI00376EBE18
MNKRKRYDILYRLREQNPYPTTELIFHSPFELLIAALLSAKSTDHSVNNATRQLFQVANTAQDMLFLGIEGIKSYIKSIGLFNRKAENIIKTCRMLIKHHQSQIPEDRTALEALPGVGHKTANLILNIAFDWPTISVDTHVFRVSNRTRFAIGKDVKTVEKKLLTVVPKMFKLHCHHWLVLHGRYTCIARSPRCTSCLIEDLCEYNHKSHL